MNKINKSFWNGRSVFVTGHTGFKGGWLSLWLSSLGARVHGYALDPPTSPSFFDALKLGDMIDSTIGDVRNLDLMIAEMKRTSPEIVFHMAAQPLVRESYKNPIETYDINVMGTAKVLEAVRKTPSVRAVVVITTDKCYENGERIWGYREDEPLGGYDPYSSSKACSEIVASAYRRSYFNPDDYDRHRVALATARAGNVLGGGDWAKDRLIPDCFRSILAGEPVIIRSPHAVRPWQHVLEPVSGYLRLGRLLYQAGPEYGESWNFGPVDRDEQTVEKVVGKLCELWGDRAGYEIGEDPERLHEASMLRLDCSKSRFRLDWLPEWSLEQALSESVEWTKAWSNGASSDEMATISVDQIDKYSNGEN
ncbi:MULTISPECIES: CDP-glucose 4,6-dehydratase [Dethiosulfovibrio]|uniref:CDP-glucose 4,6-dehydratase n=2 Tax=Dethiosulfovibrio TaxID=47054 RepID=A0ABS9EKI1_9BACT|nr:MULTISPECIES: CDP-glucose 4,6-dehydratase [Dethiosulfovibrio]MCF4113927.1 CDP-glucose 4,6-dehydratase [Dethiosulfovibrio russensis]MCF4141660.1 CDP-glucose 4,6-dehydratase [Dethiosulfovibrio marinus]MCF4143923.1 CDP-glucose 4,6-dehydratase [Dethiosulfovibrio acidaminovorans]